MSALFKAIAAFFRALFGFDKVKSPGSSPGNLGTVPPWYAVAKGYLGLKEEPGSKDNPVIVKWMQISGLAKVYWRDATAWCGVAIGNWLFEGGLKRSDLPAEMAWARNFANFGGPIDHFRIGCIVGLERNGPGGDSHVGLYAGPASSKTFYLLGGNQSDAVTIDEVSYASVIYRRWPGDTALDRAGLGDWKLSKVMAREQGEDSGEGEEKPSGSPSNPDHASLFRTMQIRTNWITRAQSQADLIEKSWSRYEALERATGVPAIVCGIIHSLESNCNFRTHLHNGDSLARRTVNVPAGRPATHGGPFTWEESAIDALQMKRAIFSQFDLDTPEGALNALERYNGLGYRKHGVYSAYLYSGSNHYARGKYVRDGVWDASAISQQVGGAVLYKVLAGRGQA